MNFDVCFNFGGWQAATMSLQDERKMIKIKLHSNWKNMLFFPRRHEWHQLDTQEPKIEV